MIFDLCWHFHLPSDSPRRQQFPSISVAVRSVPSSSHRWRHGRSPVASIHWGSCPSTSVFHCVSFSGDLERISLRAEHLPPNWFSFTFERQNQFEIRGWCDVIVTRQLKEEQFGQHSNILVKGFAHDLFRAMKMLSWEVFALFLPRSSLECRLPIPLLRGTSSPPSPRHLLATRWTNRSCNSWSTKETFEDDYGRHHRSERRRGRCAEPIERVQWRSCTEPWAWIRLSGSPGERRFAFCRRSRLVHRQERDWEYQPCSTSCWYLRWRIHLSASIRRTRVRRRRWRTQDLRFENRWRETPCFCLEEGTR